ncbi:hypothetical protein B0A49_08411, partial [Cryomyces minteri]
VLAEQFTIVEKDALDEIDWRELMEVRWKQTSPSVRNWVEYLRDEDPHGVEVVIARFNTVVKWALSECVMTEDIDERVKCIVKYIHIAAHARRLRNYATMYQITIALLSSDCSRLTRTWALVPQTDKQMESATVEEGCIPFIGIYTHDLIYNAQKPASFPSPVPGGEPLTNFERHHTSATIVKNLLRLLEASSKYNFRPDRTILSRCLWMATLDDEEISARSRKLEPASTPIQDADISHPPHKAHHCSRRAPGFDVGCAQEPNRQHPPGPTSHDPGSPGRDARADVENAKSRV